VEAEAYAEQEHELLEIKKVLEQGPSAKRALA
jgi:hypothetical protein